MTVTGCGDRFAADQPGAVMVVAVTVVWWR
jgi:hypothetical protein